MPAVQPYTRNMIDAITELQARIRARHGQHCLSPKTTAGSSPLKPRKVSCARSGQVLPAPEQRLEINVQVPAPLMHKGSILVDAEQALTRGRQAQLAVQRAALLQHYMQCLEVAEPVPGSAQKAISQAGSATKIDRQHSSPHSSLSVHTDSASALLGIEDETRSGLSRRHCL